MEMTTNKLNMIDRNMDMQNRYVKEILELVDKCEEKRLLEDVSEAEIQQLCDHCNNIAMAANTTKKLVKNLKPLAEAEDTKRKAEEEAKKKAEKAEKKKTAAEKKKTEESKEATLAETDGEMDFLG